MSRFSSRLSASPPQIVPIRGGDDQVPGSALIRGALPGETALAVARAAVAVCFWVMEQARETDSGARFWWDSTIAVPVARLAAEMGLGVSEARVGLDALRDARVLTAAADSQVRFHPDVLCEHPVLAAIRWSAVRGTIRNRGGRLGPALAVLREVARLGPVERREDGVVLRLPELVEATLYGKSAVSQALADLETAGLILRLPSPGRRALHLAAGAAAFGVMGSVAPPSTSSSAPGPAGLAVPAGAPVRLAGAASLPAPAGLVIEIGEGVRVRIQKDADGHEVCRIGPLVIGPL